MKKQNNSGKNNSGKNNSGNNLPVFMLESNSNSASRKASERRHVRFKRNQAALHKPEKYRKQNDTT